MSLDRWEFASVIYPESRDDESISDIIKEAYRKFCHDLEKYGMEETHYIHIVIDRKGWKYGIDADVRVLLNSEGRRPSSKKRIMSAGNEEGDK